MKRVKLKLIWSAGILSLMLHLLTFSPALSQGKKFQVKGSVRDKNGSPLEGANVMLKGSSAGVATNASGAYTIEVPDATGILVFTFQGYTLQEVKIAGRTKVDISLEAEDKSLEDVVVVGYGSVKKSDLTGSVSSLTVKDFNKGVVTSPDQLIAGRAAGVQVAQNSAEPGGGISILIRGVGSVTAGSEPLYVIDGLPIDNTSLISGTGTGFGLERTPRNPLSSINPQDIESIEILKDASSTAIYGSRGSNGVILVTTKKGKDGAMRINYNASLGIQKVANRLDLLNPEDYKRILNEIIAEGGGTAGSEVKDISGAGTDWLKELERSSGGSLNSHNLSMSGGTANTKYFISLGYLDQKGVIINSGFKNYSIRTNIESQLNDRFKVGINLSASRATDIFVSNGDGTNERAGSIFTASHFDPTVPIFDVNGRYYLSPFLSEDNPLALANGERATAEAYRTFGNFFAEYSITKDISVKLNVGADVTNKRRDEFNSFMTKTGDGRRGLASLFTVTNSNYIAELTAHYKKQINKQHFLDFVAGTTVQSFARSGFSTNAEGFPTDVLGTYNMGLGTPALFTSGSNKVDNKLSSFLGRANYSYLDKYLLTATIRADGSSRFGENNKFGTFPSLAFAYKLSKESFIKQTGIFEDLKFRASWGKTGNQEIGNYNSLSTFASGPYALFNQAQVLSVIPTRIANPDLKWETTEQWDIGIDVSIFGGRLTASMDYYVRNTSDMLIQLPLPSSIGFSSQLRNVGKMKNQGFEFLVESRNIVGEFNWKTTANISSVKNKVVSLGDIPEIITGSVGFVNEISIIKPGLPINSFYGYEVAGVWQTNDDYTTSVDNVRAGDLKFADQNKDKTVNASDRVVLGNGFPDFIWGLSNDLSYKNIGLNFFIEGVQGIEILNNHLVDSYFPVEFRRNRQAEPYLNRWTPTNPTNEYPSFVTPNNQGLKPVNSRVVQDGSYARLRTVTLSYSLPIRRSFIKSANISLTGQNLVTVTGYKGVDPASNGSGNANLRVENNVYPFAKSYILGINLGF